MKLLSTSLINVAAKKGWLIKKYEKCIENIRWHIETNNPPEVEIKKINSQIEYYQEFISDLKNFINE